MPDDPNDGYRYRLPANLRQQVGLGRIGREARSRGVVRSGIGIESIERAHFWHMMSGATNYSSLSQTAWTELDSTNLKWSVTTSGKRPLEFKITAWVGVDASQLLGVSLTWDGAEVTGATYGMAGVYSPANVMCVSGFAVLDDPGPGTHSLAVVHRQSGGTAGLVQVDSSTHLFVSAKEI